MSQTDIVVGIDGSIGAERALDWATDEAARLAGRLVLVHASAVVDSAAYSSATLEMMRSDATVYGNRVLDDARAAATARQPGLPVTAVLRHQRPADVLVELSGPRSIVVLGSRGGNRLTGALLGSVSQRVAAHASGTVVVVGDGRLQRSTDKGILVGVSPSAGGRAALDFACAEAARRGCRVTAVRAYGVFGRSQHSQIYAALPGLRSHEAAVLTDAVARLRVEHPDLTIDARLADEEPA
ncbi:MAG TPA: universal stress protein, partial [Jatrophihabitans sp.]|nr:universal stress protein [Jatrophihabitans sp.]